MGMRPSSWQFESPSVAENGSSPQSAQVPSQYWRKWRRRDRENRRQRRWFSFRLITSEDRPRKPKLLSPTVPHDVEIPSR